MAAQVTGATTFGQTNVVCCNTGRPSASYHPSIWKDHFLRYSSNNTEINSATKKEHEELKQEVRRMLDDATRETCERLSLIDAVQRLGVVYHFEREIDVALQKIHGDGDVGSNLYTVSLWFRLLRQHGIKVSTDVFKKFKDGEGKFKSTLVNDVPGMLSLYEATYLSVHGEDILDEALAFTTTHLESMETKVSQQLAEQIRHSLNRPIRKGLPRMEARHYISIYSQDQSCNETLLKFAKMDFNMLQALHQKELSSITEWWKSLNVTTEMPYARDRVVECYFWILGVYFEPKYSVARIFLTKVISITSILDDTYDNYGTCDELDVLTKAIERFNWHFHNYSYLSFKLEYV